MTTAAPERDHGMNTTSTWTLAAFAAALAALAGSLYLSLGMGLEACLLCFYQRTFVMGVVGVLGMGLLTAARRTGFPSLLALPLAAGGLGVAVFHAYAEAQGRMECPAGIFGLGSAPQQSLAALSAVFLLVTVDAVGGPKRGAFGRPMPLVAVLLGVLFAYAGIKSVPPPPKLDPKAYSEPPRGCRPPYTPP